MYRNGESVEKDDVEAYKWCRRAAEQGQAEAQKNLGVMYRNGECVPKDYVEAYKWVNLSAAGGNEAAMALRHELERRMSPEQIAEGQRLSREFTPKQ